MNHLSDVWFKVTDLQVSHGQGAVITTVDGADQVDHALAAFDQALTGTA